MGNDKTSWLDLNDDDDGLSDDLGDGVPFTESIRPAPGGLDREETAAGATDARTIVDPGVEKTEIAMPTGADFDPMTDPVTGWLVVVKGPGIGQSVTLGTGMNTIGRDRTASTPLPFGDTLLSREDHLRILYDDGNRAFFVAPGGGRGISRVNGALVAQTIPLENYALLELSKKTHVRFVAFCNEAFDWSDVAQDEG